MLGGGFDIPDDPPNSEWTLWSGTAQCGPQPHFSHSEMQQVSGHEAAHGWRWRGRH